MATCNLSSERVEDKCSVCLGHFKSPKVLPCCHTFCEKCLRGILRTKSNPDLDRSEGLVGGVVEESDLNMYEGFRKGLVMSDAKPIAENSSTNDSSTILSCPQCRKEHEIPKSGIDGFLTDFTVLKVKPSTEECGQCGSAKLNDTVSYCSDCAAYLCEFCTQAHKKMKLCRNHRVQLIASKGTKVDQSDDSTQVTGAPQPLFCKKHLDEVLIVYCKECQCLVCRQCITDTHFGHKFNPINETTRKEVEVKMKNLLDDSSKKLTQFRFYLEYVKGVESKKVSAPDKLKKEINDTCQNLITALEKRRHELLLQVDTCCQNFKELWSQKEQLETTIVALQSSVAFAERSLNCKSDAEMLALSQHAMLRLSELNLSKWDPTNAEQIDATQTVFQQCGTTSISPDSISGFGVVSTTTTGMGTTPNLSIEIYSQDTSQMLEEGMLGKHIRVVLKFQVLPSFVNQQISVTICNSGQQTVVYQNFPPLSVNDVENLQHQVEVTFRPVVSGQHTISVTTGDKNGQMNMKVSGRPQIGDHVIRGPNWQTPYEDYGHNYRYKCRYKYGYGSYSYDDGIVIDNSTDLISVEWDGEITTQHNWNEHNCSFEVQLV